MEEKLKKVPKLRFKDENGEDFPAWEEKKLGEVCKYRRGSFPQPYGLEKWYDEENGEPFIQVADVNDNMTLNNNTKRHISKLAEPQSVFVPKGTLIITLQGTIGRVAITNYDAYVDRTLLIVYSIEKILNKEFLKYSIFLLFSIKKQKADGGTIKTVTKDTLSGFSLAIPTLPEQTRIADFFTKLDSYIEQQELEVEKLKEQKKGFMQKIFSQEIRFKDENGEDFPAWEEKKLGDIAEIIKGKQLNKLQLEKSGKYYVLNGGIVPSGYCNNYNTEANMISISEGGASCGYVNFNKERFWSGGHNYVIKTSQIEKKFLYQLLKFNEEKIMRLRVGSGLPNIQKNALKRLLLKVAISKEEQTRIADFFTKLDEQIEVEKAILEKWKLLKKGFLQQMFI